MITPSIMRERGISSKEAVNEAIRGGLSRRPSGQTVDFPTYDMGESAVPQDKALRLSGEMEDDELIRRLAVRT